MRFSICMAAKNAENTIGYALQSILSQSFCDYEVIIVDDHSQDHTIEIANGFKDERIKVFSGQYDGLLKARVQTIELASGEYVITVDADDALTIGALEDIDNMLSQTEVDILNYKGVKVFGNGKHVALPDLLPDMTLIYGTDIKDIFDSLVFSDDFTTLWNKAIKRSCINVKSIKECPNLSIGEDNIILLFTFPNAKSYCYTTKTFYLYTASGGITKKFRGDSYSNQKMRMECKRLAIEKAGYEYEKYEERLRIVFVETVSKICAYFPTRVGADEKSKDEFFSCLKEIQEDDEFWKSYDRYKERVGTVYKIPLWLVKKRMNAIVMIYKNLCATLRT